MRWWLRRSQTCFMACNRRGSGVGHAQPPVYGSPDDSMVVVELSSDKKIVMIWGGDDRVRWQRNGEEREARGVRRRCERANNNGIVKRTRVSVVSVASLIQYDVTSRVIAAHRISSHSAASPLVRRRTPTLEHTAVFQVTALHIIYRYRYL